MKPSVYIETSIISYLTAQPSRDVIVYNRQKIGDEWWLKVLKKVEPVISPYVITEAAYGDPIFAEKRLRLIQSFRSLPVNKEIEKLGEKYFGALNIPEKSRIDALHIATAVWHKIDYLLSWNCKHIASARVQKRLRDINAELKLTTPVVCTPEELMEV